MNINIQTHDMTLRNILYTLTIFLASSFTINAQDSTFHSSKKDTTAFVQIIQDPNIEVINNYYKEMSSTDTMINGYRIQIYFGSRNKAYSEIESFHEVFPDTKAKVIYESPNFKTVVGRYPTKLDADRELKKIQEEFPGAFMVRNKMKRE
ncbi:MAG: SPOR domain-containing protein [Flavobacteriales bacterium]|nr:SPOR domain-containing protein [Flavobacteriales bacterium]